MLLGVQTHFSQGWNTTLLNKLADLGVSDIRDSVPWNQVETQAGVYDFKPALTSYLDKSAGMNVNSLLTFASGNALYDSGLTPYTEEGRQKYADYIVQVLQKYSGQVHEVEIWNEFNGTFKGIVGTDQAHYYNELLKTVWNTVKPLFPDVKILGGSTNVIGTGALDGIFKLGALDHMDGVVVHPYRGVAEHVDDELNHLRDVMAGYGKVVPIYATEFGNEFKTAAEVPDFMVKMVTLMSSAGVSEAYWYSLLDEKYHSNMGLLTNTGERKPAADAFAFIEKNLLSNGDAHKVSTGDTLTEAYKFGADTYVLWSAGRSITFSPGGKFYDTTGHEVAAPTQLTMSPIIYKGAGYTLGGSTIIADSLMQFNEGVWSYYAKSANGALTELSNVDNNWTSYLGSKYTKPLRVNADSIAPAGDGKNPIQVVERYTSDKMQDIKVKGSWTTGDGDGVDLHILLNGKEIYTKVFVGTFDLTNFLVHLNKGDTLDFALGPNQTVQGDSTLRHITLETSADTSTKVAVMAPAPIELVALQGKMAGTDKVEKLTSTTLWTDKDQVVAMKGGNDQFIFSQTASPKKLNGIIDMGAGSDTIIFNEGMEDYGFTFRADGSVKVKAVHTGDTVTFKSAETFQFNDLDHHTSHSFSYAELYHEIAIR